MMRKYITITLACIIFLIFIYFVLFSKKTITKEEVEKHILEDLITSYPDADKHAILNISSSGDGLWDITARVTFDLYSPCPKRVHVHYSNYPEFGFIKREENITKGCEVCKDEPICVLIYEEEAIIASHMDKFGDVGIVKSYINEHSDAKPFSTPYEEFKDIKNITHKDVWVVEWKAESADFYVVTILKKVGGEVIKTYTVT